MLTAAKVLEGVREVEHGRSFCLSLPLDLPGGMLVPTAPERELVRESLAARQRRELVPLLEDLAGRPMEPAERVEALSLLGRAGTAEHLKLLTRLTVSPAGQSSQLPKRLMSRVLSQMTKALPLMRSNGTKPQ